MFARGAFLSRPAPEFPEFPELAFQRRFGGLRRLAQTLKGTCSMGAANIQAVNQREAVNQRAIDVALAELHRGE